VYLIYKKGKVSLPLIIVGIPGYAVSVPRFMIHNFISYSK